MSRQYFDFSGLIRKYESQFEVVTHESGGYDERGEWKAEAEKRTLMRGAIIAFKESKVLRSDGGITAKDRKLHMLQKLPDALIGAEVRFKGQRYTIESELENAEFTGVYSYLLKWVSALDTD